MKIILIFFALLLLNPIVSQNKQENNSDYCQHELLNKMYDFFTETLRKKYHIKDDKQLYTKFIQSYIQQIENAKRQNKNKYYKIRLSVKKKRISEVNKRLLIRDTCNYYYFYKDRIVFKDKVKWEQVNKIELQYPEIPITSKLVIHPNENAKIIPYEETYNINLNFKFGFFTKPNVKDLELVKILKEMNQNFGDGISVPMFASAINKQKSDILNDKRERIIIVVVFWKALCVNANVSYNFHRIPNNIKEIFGI